jgi:hypothetical protein
MFLLELLYFKQPEEASISPHFSLRSQAKAGSLMNLISMKNEVPNSSRPNDIWVVHFGAILFQTTWI